MQFINHASISKQQNTFVTKFSSVKSTTRRCLITYITLKIQILKRTSGIVWFGLLSLRRSTCSLCFA